MTRLERPPTQPPEGLPRRPAPLWKKLSLSAVSLLLTVLLLEAATRLFVAAPAPVRLREGIYVNQLAMVNGRDTVHTVEGPALPEQKRNGEKRVFVFGESSIEGAPWAYSGSPPTMLYDQLRESLPAQDLTVVNMGRSASMTRDAYYFLVTIERYRPDFIVFYQGMNDEFHTDAEACLPATHPRLHGAWRWLVERSRFLWTVRALGPPAYARWRHVRYEPGPEPPAPSCDERRAFRAWVDALVGTARRMGAQVLVTTVVENPLRYYEANTPWGASQPLDLPGRDAAYRRLLSCVLTPGCDLAAAFASEQARSLHVDEQAEERSAAWRASAAARGAHTVDLRAYLDDHTAGGFKPPIFAEDVHLLLEGYWRLAWLWSDAIRALLEGRAPSAAALPEPPALDRARYLSEITRDNRRSPACILLLCADVYLRRGNALVGASLLESALAYDPERTSRASAQAELVAASLRRDLGLDPALPPALAAALDRVDLPRMAAELREHDDCSTVGASTLGPPGAVPSPAGGGRDDRPSPAQYVILPGQEQVVGGMLGMDGSKPGGCALEGAQIQRDHVRASYRCPDGAAVIELRHPSERVPVLARTERFVIAAGEPPPGPALVAALAAAIRKGEAAFEWHHPAGGKPDAPPPPAPRPRRWGLALAGAALVGALLALLRWRSRASR
jgi:hypothetical protein